MANENTYHLKLELYNIDRKMKNIIRCIFISMIMHQNFPHFRQKISYKRVIESFTSVSGHFALNKILKWPSSLSLKVVLIWKKINILFLLLIFFLFLEKCGQRVQFVVCCAGWERSPLPWWQRSCVYFRSVWCGLLWARFPNSQQKIL